MPEQTYFEKNGQSIECNVWHHALDLAEKGCLPDMQQQVLIATLDGTTNETRWIKTYRSEVFGAYCYETESKWFDLYVTESVTHIMFVNTEKLPR